MKAALLRLIRGYQVLFSGRPSPCRFQPTCSEYAREAIEMHGAGRGSWLAVCRLCKCHPLGPHGWDPVPDVHHHSNDRLGPDSTVSIP